MLSRTKLVVVLLVSTSLAACGGSTTPAAGATATAAPVRAPAGVPAAASSAGGSTKAITLTDIFPPGPGRDLVLSNCGSCHPAACLARGQRSAALWDSVGEGHKDKVTGLSDDVSKTLYAYLKQNFNDTKPEPQVPAVLLQPSCTPF